MLRRVIALLWLTPGLAPLYGATLERLSLDDMIAKSTAVVRGRVNRSWGAASGNHIFTHYQVQVLERWKGPDVSTVEVIIPGGQSGARREVCSGAPNLAESQDYVLFLWTGKSGLTQVIGLTQGVFTLPKDPATGQTLAVRPASTEIMLDTGAGRVVNDQGVVLPLNELSARISSVLAKGAQ